MIIPSIDIKGGRAVQLRGGRHPELDVGDPEILAATLSKAGEIAVIDLDAALGKGDNRRIIERIASKYPCRVGGGIRTQEIALRYLDIGARYIIVGTRTESGFLSALPRARLMAALDSSEGTIMVDGWTRPAEGSVEDRIKALMPFVSGFLITSIEREGELQGIDMDNARRLARAAGNARITFAGGASGGSQGIEQIRELDNLGADIQIGTALATGELSLAQAFSAPLVSDRSDGLWPTLVCDEGGRALGLAYSSLESLTKSFESGRGVYHSRRRGLWIKGDTSGDSQRLIRAEVDCDRDCVRFIVRQEGRGFCHTGTWTCFDDGYGIEKLSRTIAARLKEAPEGSYTRRLSTDRALLASKLKEEADELAAAARPEEAAFEAADVIYFALVKALGEGARLSDIEEELERRSLRVRRRPGDAKPGYSQVEGGSPWSGIH